jgi:DNA invertase Pin-like site-specific DNA recombinase
MTMMEDLEKWGKKFTSMNESLDTSNAVGRFVVDIIQRIAQLESEQIGERTYMGMRQKAESLDGMLGFNAPFGYHMEHENLRMVPEEAAEVRKVFTDYMAGKTMASIANDMNERGVLTRRGKEWTVWSISNMLHNPVYSGNLRWDGLLLPSPHERAVDMELFNSVQLKMAGKVRIQSRRSYCQLREHETAVKLEEFKVRMT